MSCDVNQRRIDDVVSGELSAAAWSELRSHLGTCEACRARYDRAAMMARALDGGLDSILRPSAGELDRVGTAVLDEIAPVRKAGMRRFFEALSPSPKWTAAWAFGAAAVLLLVAIPLRPRSPGAGPSADDSPETLQARGTATAEQRGSVRAFCVGVDGTVREDKSCRVTEQLRFTVTNKGYKYLFLVGADDKSAPKWYAPTPPETRSVAISDGVDQPVGHAVRINVNHGVGKLRVYALFSNEPLESTEIERALSNTTVQGSRLLSQPQDVAQEMIGLEIKP